MKAWVPDVRELFERRDCQCRVAQTCSLPWLSSIYFGKCDRQQMFRVRDTAPRAQGGSRIIPMRAELRSPRGDKIFATSRKNGSRSHRVRWVIMVTSPYLSDAEFVSLAEVGKGFWHGPIPANHALRLLELKLTYNLLGSLRITSDGRKMLKAVQQEPELDGRSSMHRH